MVCSIIPVPIFAARSTNVAPSKPPAGYEQGLALAAEQQLRNLSNLSLMAGVIYITTLVIQQVWFTNCCILSKTVLLRVNLLML